MKKIVYTTITNSLIYYYNYRWTYCCVLWSVCKCISGVMVTMVTSCATDRGFIHSLGQTMTLVFIASPLI